MKQLWVMQTLFSTALAQEEKIHDCLEDGDFLSFANPDEFEFTYDEGGLDLYMRGEGLMPAMKETFEVLQPYLGDDEYILLLFSWTSAAGDGPGNQCELHLLSKDAYAVCEKDQLAEMIIGHFEAARDAANQEQSDKREVLDV